MPSEKSVETITKILASFTPARLGSGFAEREFHDNVCMEIASDFLDAHTAEALAEHMRVLDDLRPLVEAAHGLSFGTDWNEGTHAIEHGYRKALLDSLPKALAAIAKLKGKQG